MSGSRRRASVDDQADAILGMVITAAQDGAPCPKNREIAAETGVRFDDVSNRLARLVQDGLIAIERSACLNRRRILIVADGAITDWTGRRANWRSLPQPEVTPEDEIPNCAPADVGAVCEAIAPLSVAEQVKAEALERAARRDAARSGAACAYLSVGAQIQMDQLADGPGAARSSLRERWPETHELLGRMAWLLGERPLPLLVRLINDEAARIGMRRAGDQ